MMNTPHLYRRNTPMAHHGAAPHLYVVGQAVRLIGGFDPLSRAAGVYRVTRRLPPSPQGDTPQYRVRSDSEGHERMASQNELEAVADGGAALMERTFHRG